MKKGAVKRFLKISGKRLKTVSPHLAFIFGIAGVIYTVVDACKTTKHLEEDIYPELNAVEKLEDEIKILNTIDNAGPETIKEAEKDLKKARRKAFVAAAKRYIRPVVVGVASIVLLGTAHVMLTKTVIASSATLSALSTEYKNYRDAAVEKYGEDVDKELRFAHLNKNKKEVEKITIDPETGEEKKETTLVTEGIGLAGLGAFAIPFCKTYCGSVFSNDHYYDTSCISMYAEWIQEQLEVYNKSVVFLDEVYKKFGYDITPASRKAGWRKGSIPRITYEEGYYDWGTGNGVEKTYILDFNCEPDVIDAIPAPKPKWHGV